MIMGIWDGHDAGAAVVENGRIVAAVNEERFTRRKLEVSFPWNSVRWLAQRHEIDEAAVPTFDISKTLSRILPSLKERHYLVRRRKVKPPLTELSKMAKIATTAIPGNRLTLEASRYVIGRQLAKLGIDVPVRVVNHHEAHAWTATQSGFRSSLVLVMDGVGDGLSASLWSWDGKELEMLKAWDVGKSIAQFFEFTTYHLGFRELEDEGKVSALATYSYPEKNIMEGFFSIKGLEIVPKYSLLEMFKKIGEIAWKLPRERVAWMAQNAIEHWVTELVSNIVDEYGEKRIGFAGGLFANVRLNMAIREKTGIRPFIFPHMGDGGIAAGAALSAEGASRKIRDVYLGPEFTPDAKEVKQLAAGISGARVYVRESERPWEDAAEAVLEGGYVFWFQGRMEYGPRALGNRSIIARPDMIEAKDMLNMRVKRRQWYQPFCPTVLWEDSRRVFRGVRERNGFMTTAYRVREEWLEKMRAVTSVDGVARPQMLSEENSAYRKLVKEVGKEVGVNAVLNTSFNIHGEPIVMSPVDAIKTAARAGGRLVVGNVVADFR